MKCNTFYGHVSSTINIDDSMNWKKEAEISQQEGNLLARIKGDINEPVIELRSVVEVRLFVNLS